MITSAENRAWPGDVSLEKVHRQAGLPAPSVVRPCKTATIEASHADRLGSVDSSTAQTVSAAIRRYLGLG